MTPTLFRALLCTAVAVGLSGCAILHPFTHEVQVRQIAPAQDVTSNREDGYYASAKTAIARRDYALALELLQAARALKPDDVRVLNAFGVVYDKLGRFDLSGRYYAQAEALDPGSLVLAHNMAWSAALYGRSTAPAPAPSAVQLASGSPPAPVVESVATPDRPAVLRIGFPAEAPAAQPLLRRGVAVANASGRDNAAAPVVQGLIRLGWSPRSEAHSATTPTTTITYPTAKAAVAKALALTLPERVQLVDCGQACDGVRLVLGVDSTKWRTAASELKRRS